MFIDWTHFTPWSSLFGGALIGVAASALILFNGRVAGISGIVGGLFASRSPGDSSWRVAFLAGMVCAVVLWAAVANLPVVQIDAGTSLLVLAGLMVGVGTRYGGGCTSGHGVCGMSRGSIRSIVATLCFMVSGASATYVLRHMIGA